MSVRTLLLLALALGVGLTEGQARPPRPGPVRPVPLPIGGMAPLGPGFHARMRVLTATRFDVAFAVPPEARAEAGTAPRWPFYQLYVPRTYNHRVGQPLVLFLSPDNEPDEFKRWSALCDKYGVVYASPYAVGPDVPEAVRVRIALDVLDDVRRRLHIDTDRCYLAGAGTGGRTACAIGFALPEAFGGVVCVGAGRAPRLEPDLRLRAGERLSVALLTGERGPGRAEVQRYLAPLLRACAVPTRSWSYSGADRSLPGAAELEEVFLWLEDSLPRRQALAANYPASRIANIGMLTADNWARALLQEALLRLEGDAKMRRSGLMQLQSILTRWPGSTAAAEAERQLTAYDARAAVPVRSISQEEQQRFAAQRAQAHDALLAGAEETVVRTAIALWEQVAALGRETKLGREATARLATLRRMLP